VAGPKISSTSSCRSRARCRRHCRDGGAAVAFAEQLGAGAWRGMGYVDGDPGRGGEEANPGTVCGRQRRCRR
jgi:hypothetical protein